MIFLLLKNPRYLLRLIVVIIVVIIAIAYLADWFCDTIFGRIICGIFSGISTALGAIF
jgi:predicted MFS family arabinose efflux permease